MQFETPVAGDKIRITNSFSPVTSQWLHCEHSHFINNFLYICTASHPQISEITNTGFTQEENKLQVTSFSEKIVLNPGRLKLLNMKQRCVVGQCYLDLWKVGPLYC